MDEHEGYYDYDYENNYGKWVYYKDTYTPSPLKGMFVHDDTALVVSNIQQFEESALFALIHKDKED